MVKVFVIMDGVGDKPCKALDNLTPLQAAKTKNLDYFSEKSNHGYVYAINEHVAPESDEAVMALLGYDPKRYYYGRGPLEAYGAGMNFEDGNLALRANFATLDKDGKNIIDRRAGRTLLTKEAKLLAEAINNEIKLEIPFVFKATVGHRGVLLFKGDDLSANISNIDPAYKKVGKFGVAVGTAKNNIQEALALDPNRMTKLSARLVNDFTKKSYEVLKENELNIQRRKKYLLEANVILTRDAGVMLPVLPKKREWGAVVSMPLEIGITKLAGMHVLKFEYPEMKSREVYDNLYDGLKTTIKESIKHIKERKYEKYFIHFKEIDIPGHDNNPKEKKKMIELVDKKFFKFLRKLSKKEKLELVVTGDHSTPCEMKGHSSDPVPLLHFGAEKKDCINRFNEEDCLDGHYGKLYGKEVLKKVGFE